MTTINLTAQHWDGMFNKTLNWYNCEIDVDDLDDLYNYHDYTKDTGEFGHHRPNKNIRQIFKFEYSELYESGKLIDENGNYYTLSKEDIKYLNGKDGKYND